MSKKAIIAKLFNEEGLGLKAIVEKTGYLYGYVSNVLGNLRHPGAAKKAQDRYLLNLNMPEKADRYQHYRETKKRWKKDHPDLKSKHRRQNIANHQEKTKGKATNHRQGWTTREVEYLRDHGQKKTVEQLALDLARTYCAIMGAGYRYRIDLRGNKTKTGSSRVSATPAAQ